MDDSMLERLRKAEQLVKNVGQNTEQDHVKRVRQQVDDLRGALTDLIAIMRELHKVGK